MPGVAALYKKYVGRKAVMTVCDRTELKATQERADKARRRGESIAAGTVIRHRNVGIQIGVEIVDVRTRFGVADVLVTPAVGSGSTWVSVDRIRVVEEWDDADDFGIEDDDGINETEEHAEKHAD